MTMPLRFGNATATALARSAARSAAAIAAEVPRDVTVTWSDGVVRLTGARLSLRALTDPRLRDFAAIVRSGGRR
ncbi:hypothetical protein [Sphingomonas sp.]|uniref:hypothetical protein n=1 Tax=Sphingomonas sp. TaxID=28214 RepID=UPI003B00B8CE